MSILDLPNEVLMEIFTWFPLRSLIVAQGVDQRWRQLAPLVHIMPARRSLLNLYLKAISTPQVLDVVHEMKHHIRIFDRWGYLASLEARNQGAELPEEFRVWILEWPSPVLGWTWPGLNVQTLDAAHIMSTHGLNRLSHLYPIIEDVTIYENIRDAEGRHLRCEKALVRALEVYKRHFWSEWLVVGGNQTRLQGTVQAITAQQSMLKGTALIGVVGEMEKFRSGGWVEWLSTQLRISVEGHPVVPG